MDVTKLLILSLGCMSGFMITSYQGIAEQRGWPIGKIFILEKAGWIAILGILCQYGCVLVSFFVNPWWSAFIVLIIGFFANMLLTSIFKKYTQPLAGVLVFISYILIANFVFIDLEDERNFNHFKTSMVHATQVADIANREAPFTVLTVEEIGSILETSRAALREARKVDIGRLNSRLLGFGDHYQRQFIVGLELVIVGFEQHDSEKMMLGQLSQNKWNEWYRNNLEMIKNGK